MIPSMGPMRQLGVQTWLGKTPDECAVPRASRPLKAYPQMTQMDADGRRCNVGAGFKPARRMNPQMTQMDADGSFAGGGEAIESAKPILEGVRVLDLSNVLAGPSQCAYVGGIRRGGY